MKRLFLSAVVMMAMAIPGMGELIAQDAMSGTVTYEQTTSLDYSGMMRGNDGAGMRHNNMMKDMRASLPKERKESKFLYFSDSKSLFVGGDAQTQRPIMERHGRRMMVSFENPTEPKLQEVYYDFDKRKKTELVGFMSRDFLVSGEIGISPWKLTSKVTKILDHTCMAAQMVRDDKAITAWFTSEIPVSVGPADYFGLPGLVLAVEIDGETALLATAIDLTPPADGLLVKPRGGKKVSQKKFDKIMAEKIKEFEETRDEDGGRVIRFRH